MNRFADKTVIVTGAASGIGRASARLFAAEGGKVVAADRSAQVHATVAAIREAGGEVIIQDEPSAVVWGMPGLVYAAGQADGVFPLDQLAADITRRVLRNRTPHATFTSDNNTVLEPRAQ